MITSWGVLGDRAPRDRAGLGPGWPGTGLAWHWAGLGPGWPGTGLAWHWAGLAPGWPGAGLPWAGLGAGLAPGWPGVGLPWAGSGLGCGVAGQSGIIGGRPVVTRP